MLLEQFKQIPQFPNYSVSNWGQVRNDQTGLVRKLQTDAKGYKRVGLNHNGTQAKHYVHRLVAQAFIPNPENKPQVNHIQSELKGCNYLWNLEWATAKEDSDHKIRLGRQAKGETQGNSKLRKEQVLEIYNLLEAGNLSAREIGDIYGVAKDTIGDINTGANWKWLMPKDFQAKKAKAKTIA